MKQVIHKPILINENILLISKVNRSEHNNVWLELLFAVKSLESFCIYTEWFHSSCWFQSAHAIRSACTMYSTLIFNENNCNCINKFKFASAFVCIHKSEFGKVHNRTLHCWTRSPSLFHFIFFHILSYSLLFINFSIDFFYECVRVQQMQYKFHSNKNNKWS